MQSVIASEIIHPMLKVLEIFLFVCFSFLTAFHGKKHDFYKKYAGDFKLRDYYIIEYQRSMHSCCNILPEISNILLSVLKTNPEDSVRIKRIDLSISP